MTQERSPSLLRIEISSTPRTVEVALIGEMDLSTRGQLLRTLQGTPRNGAAAVNLDLARLEFCDAAGLADLLDVRDALALEHRAYSLHDARPLLLRLLELTGLRDLLDPSTA